LRTNDFTTVGATERLFKIADTPEAMIKVPTKRLERIIYPVGFYRNKAKTLHSISRDIIKRFDGKVPSNIEALLTLKGVGRKTANLVLTLGYGKLGICVDVHVHRISNRLGFIKTKNPEKSEFALRMILPKKYWIEYNDILVAYGQYICRPISPKCSICKVSKHCRQFGVTTRR
jgi:endonuclease-3